MLHRRRLIKVASSFDIRWILNCANSIPHSGFLLLHSHAPQLWHGAHHAATTTAASRLSTVQKMESPSVALVDALKSTGHWSAVPPEPPPGKIDLSYHDPAHFLDESRKDGWTLARPRERFHDVVARIIRSLFVDARLCRPADAVGFQEKVRHAVTQRGWWMLQAYEYEAADAVLWAWILVPQSSLIAVLRLVLVCNARGLGNKPSPTFLVSFLLRRGSIASPALRILLFHVQHRLENRFDPQWFADTVQRENPAWQLTSEQAEEESREMLKIRADLANTFERIHEPFPDEVTDVSTKPPETGLYGRVLPSAVMVLVVRFLRHARFTEPALLPAIARLFCDHAFPRWLSSGGRDRGARLAFSCNRLLELLAQPCARDPYQSVVHQQEAQNLVVETMRSATPPVLVSGAGFRAIVRVQLAHRKTASEREWADLKAESWPPWREDRPGPDAAAAVTNLKGVSRAGRALAAKAESGYVPGNWDKAATVLAGWDTDGSPTIQTRRILPRRTQDQGEDEELVWHSRIAATRTCREAWAVFLSYQDRGLPPVPEVYNEMLDKLLRDWKRAFNPGSVQQDNVSAEEADRPLPGDSLETQAPPRDPRAEPYTRSPPPEPTTFLESMIERKIRVRANLLPLLLESTSKFDQVVRALTAGGVPDALIRQLTKEAPINFSALPPVHKLERILPAYLSALIRMSPTRSEQPQHWWSLLRHSWDHAWALLDTWQPRYYPAWRALLLGVAMHNDPARPGQEASFQARLHAWRVMRDVLAALQRNDMPVPLDAFYIMVRQYGRLAYRGRQIAAGLHFVRAERTNFNRAAIRNIVVPDLQSVKGLFQELVGVPYPLPGPQAQAGPDTVGGESDSACLEPEGIGKDYADTTASAAVLEGFPDHSTSSSDQEAAEAPASQLPATGAVAMTTNDVNGEATADATQTESASNDHEVPSSAHLELPELHQVPQYEHLRALVRTLGSARDYCGIVDTLRWIRHYAPVLDAQPAGPDGGARARRRILVTARAALEVEWYEHKYRRRNEQKLPGGNIGAPAELQEEAARIVDEMGPAWGGWPEAQEVKEAFPYMGLWSVVARMGKDASSCVGRGARLSAHH